MATPNQDTDIKHMPPNPNVMNPLPTAHGQTPTGELYPRKADEATPTQHKLHTQPRSKQPRHVLHPTTPPSAPRWQGKDPAHCCPSFRPQVQQGRHPRNHTDTPNHCHCNDNPGRNIIQVSSTTAAQPIQMPVQEDIHEEDTSPSTPPHTLQPHTSPSSPPPRPPPPKTQQPTDQHTAKAAKQFD
ncbi:hypothetical protein CRENBAI_008500 [Crenichthys baileyi]|uniref:Uncharacterized protein n=1 Tax=Crenichthys baileyi TaxID=28760 RepID=A0AAV9R502_9TELE